MSEYTLRLISLGAGVQSTAMLLMAQAGELDEYGKVDGAVFADTGWEPRAVMEHLEWLKGVSTIPIYVVSQGDLRADVIAKRRGDLPFHVKNADGDHALLRRSCTRDYKIYPIQKQTRILLGLKKGQRIPKGVRTQAWQGISLDEIQRMKVNPLAWVDNFYPLVESGLSRHSCKLWLQDHGYPIPARSACIGCPFHGDDYWRKLKAESPDEFADAVEFDHWARDGCNNVKFPAYLHTSLQPLDEVDFRNEEDRGQIDAFGFLNECEGYCGV